jgi:hypothetical protein
MRGTSESRTTSFEPFPDFCHRVSDEKVVDEDEKSARAVRTKIVENLHETALLKPFEGRGGLPPGLANLLRELVLRATPLGAPVVSERQQRQQHIPLGAPQPVLAAQLQVRVAVEIQTGSSKVARL